VQEVPRGRRGTDGNFRKGAALRTYIDNEYEAMAKVAKALNLTPQ
jgi:hypothetical protein